MEAREGKEKEGESEKERYTYGEIILRNTCRRREERDKQTEAETETDRYKNGDRKKK